MYLLVIFDMLRSEIFKQTTQMVSNMNRNRFKVFQCFAKAATGKPSVHVCMRNITMKGESEKQQSLY